MSRLTQKSKKSSVDDIQKIIRRAGYRATTPRSRILQILKESGKPLSVRTLVRQVKKYRIDQATVYRTLKSLTTANIIRPVDVRHDHAHYEMRDPKDHHHLICSNCGLVIDFEECDIPSLIKKALRATKQFARIDDHALEFFGICKSCDRKRKLI